MYCDNCDFSENDKTPLFELEICIPSASQSDPIEHNTIFCWRLRVLYTQDEVKIQEVPNLLPTPRKDDQKGP